MVDLETLASLVMRMLERQDVMLASQSAMATRLDTISHHLQPPPDLRLLLAIVEQFGDASFTAREVIRRGRQISPLLSSAIEAACGRIDGRVLGQRLARLSKSDIGTFRLVRLHSERDGAVWRIYPERVAPMKPTALVAVA